MIVGMTGACEGASPEGRAKWEVLRRMVERGGGGGAGRVIRQRSLSRKIGSRQANVTHGEDVV